MANPQGATSAVADFVDSAGIKIGEFKGLICIDNGAIEGHGEGGYEPIVPARSAGDEAVPKAADVEIKVRIRFKPDDAEVETAIEGVISYAFIRRGIIGFRAWPSQK